MEKSLEDLDREIEQELREISEMTYQDNENLDRMESRVDTLQNETSTQIENEIIKSEYYAKVIFNTRRK